MLPQWKTNKSISHTFGYNNPVITVCIQVLLIFFSQWNHIILQFSNIRQAILSWVLQLFHVIFSWGKVGSQHLPPSLLFSPLTLPSFLLRSGSRTLRKYLWATSRSYTESFKKLAKACLAALPVSRTSRIGRVAKCGIPVVIQHFQGKGITVLSLLSDVFQNVPWVIKKFHKSLDIQNTVQVFFNQT